MCLHASLQVTHLLGSKLTIISVDMISQGNSDWFRVETKDDTLQPTIDMLLNVSFFIWAGAVCPWHSFAHNNVIPIYRLIFIGVLILLFRRLPFVLAIHKRIHEIEEWRQAGFVGYFGPIGVSAVFYLYIAIGFLQTNVLVDGQERPDATNLVEVLNVVVWFLVICSVVSPAHSPFLDPSLTLLSCSSVMV
jgi:sodium/hydrogen antiporter